MRLCSNCKIEKSINCFNKISDGYAKCKSCVADYNRSYYKKHKEKLNKNRYESPEDKVYFAKRYQDKRIDICIKNEVYRKLNLGKYAAKEAKRRSRKLFATPSWLTKDHLNQIENFYWLAKDLKAVTGETYHVDHIVPLQGKGVCGLHVPWNLQILPSDINLSKRNKHLP